MSALGNPNNIKTERMSLSWSAQEVTSVVTVADVADSLDGKYFTINSANDAIAYYCWMDGAVAADPAPAGKTAIPVAYTTGDSAATIAGLIVTAVDAVADFHAKIDPCDNTKVIIQNAAIGDTTDSADVDTLFTIATELQGSELAIGFTDSLSVSVSGEELLDVTAQQLGTTVIQRLRTGRNLEALSVPMKESDAAKLKEILLATGVAVTPSGGSQVIGIGSSRDGEGTLADSRKLVMHPVRLAAASLDEDFCWWRAYPNVTSIDLNGDSEELINVEFSFLPDPLINAEAEMFVFGDHTQNFLK